MLANLAGTTGCDTPYSGTAAGANPAPGCGALSRRYSSRRSGRRVVRRRAPCFTRCPQPPCLTSEVERVPLDSEALSSVGYDASQRVLEVEFASGRVYQYFDVPQHEVERLLRAPSRGHYFSERVRDRYRYAQVH